MRISASLFWLALLQLSSPVAAELSLAARQLRPRDYNSRDYYALEISEYTPPAEIASHFGLEYEGPIGQLRNHHLFSAPLGPRDVVGERLEEYQRRRKRDVRLDDLYGSVLFAEKQKLKKLEKRSLTPSSKKRDVLPLPRQLDESGKIELKEIMKTLNIKDPIFDKQWHLFNPKQRGHDVNVTGLWKQGVTGKGVIVSIVDDGLDMYSNDLKDNYFAEGSYDFNEHVAEPKPRLSDDRHGTRCAGEVAAVRNNVCGVGVAYDSKVSGIRILSKQITDADEAIALNYAYDQNHIYSCSWGPPDDGRSMDAPGVLIKRSMVNGIQNGRHGLGSVFVFASGNGASYDDNCNFDGYTNSIYSITVGAVDRTGGQTFYSEPCSANMVVTYSSGNGDAIHTTDVGTNQCSDTHGGTSAAAPLAAGIFALVLSVRPDLSWRDLQYLCVETASMVNEHDAGWETTAIGKKFNHHYGYGSLDAYAIVEAARTWKVVKPQAWLHSPLLKVNHAIPEGNTGLTSHISFMKKDLVNANLERVEHVTVTMNLEHQRRGDVSVDLISPKGIVSHIATVRSEDTSVDGYNNWTFMTVKHWGEDAVGEWTIIVKDNNENDMTGELVDWQLSLWGECIDEDKAVLHPLPGDSMNATHPIPHPFTSTASVATTSLPIPSTSQKPMQKPSEHVDRPTVAKPTTTGQSGTNGSKPGDTNTGTGDSEASTDRPLFIPSFLPTFGVSGKTQVWIYGAFTIIIMFVAGVAVYLCVQKRKRKASNNDYEFAVLEDEEDGVGMAGGSSSRATGAGAGRRRAKDLYDAFGASDDDGDIFSDDDDDDYKNARDYELEEEEQARGIDEGKRVIGGDREALLGRNRD